MQLAERMAQRAIGSTYPNPPVGAIIVKDKIIIARGWTQKNGSPHAEVHAINQVRNKKQLEGASIYTTLTITGFPLSIFPFDKTICSVLSNKDS